MTSDRAHAIAHDSVRDLVRSTLDRVLTEIATEASRGKTRLAIEVQPQALLDAVTYLLLIEGFGVEAGVVTWGA